LIDLCVAASITAVGAILTGAEFGDFSWQLDVLGQFLLLAPIGATLVLVFCLATRRRQFAAYSAIALIVASVMAFPWLTGPSPASPQKPHFSLLLFNVYRHNKTAADVRDLVRKTDADVVVLVEVTPSMSTQLGDLSKLYPHRYECIGTQDCDILILSKGELESPRAQRLLSDPNLYLTSAHIEIAGCHLTLFATHMSHPGRGQLLEADNIAYAMAGIGGARVLVGDFNGVPWGSNVQTLLKLSQFTLAEGIGGTYPSRLLSYLALPIDHVLTSPGVEVTKRQVLPSAGSDHLPVLLGVTFVDRSVCRGTRDPSGL
jgi:endonuclease/exonuclease/phosphatase (EEP) superfamily protein YafD